jgi:Ser/Thr protein kinase RdoA (MazF antagonist)
MRSHAAAIAAHFAEWDEPVVDEAIFGTSDPEAIADTIDAWCHAVLGAGVVGARFVASSIGSVHGLVLDDGREVVVKAHQPGRDLSSLRAVQKVQSHLAEHGYPAPRPLVSPVPLGRGLGWAEELLDRGAPADAHLPPVRKAIAESLAQLIALAQPFSDERALDHKLFDHDGPALWPRPHGKIFDFERTARGAEWIDALARRAKENLAAPSGETIVGHSDLRAEHVRILGEPPAIVAVFDWDSLIREREPILVGGVAHGFTADWCREGNNQAPTVEEARAFVADYEAARGHAFDREERRTLAAAFAYGIAYTARCGHALAPATPREEFTDFRALLAVEGERLLLL